MSLAIVDTGCANLSSVAFAFERLGVTAKITDDVETILTSDRVVLPGVGAAPYAMQNIQAKNLTDPLRALQQPLLGICLGMQLLYERLEEGDTVTQGLGLIDGSISRLDTAGQPSPHMGWNALKVQKDSPLTQGIIDQDYVYFVHTYAAPLSDATIASSQYGSEFSAIVQKDNVMGCQFHPERSSAVGAKILSNFLKA